MLKLERSEPAEAEAEPPAGQPQARWFARITAAEIACPKCGRVTVLRSTGIGAKTNSRYWNPRLGRWRCQECKFVLYLGVVGWRVRCGPQAVSPPEDWVPTIAQAVELRGLVNSLRGGKQKGARGERRDMGGGKGSRERRNELRAEGELKVEELLGYPAPAPAPAPIEKAEPALEAVGLAAAGILGIPSRTVALEEEVPAEEADRDPATHG